MSIALAAVAYAAAVAPVIWVVHLHELRVHAMRRRVPTSNNGSPDRVRAIAGGPRDHHAERYALNLEQSL